MPLSKLLQNLFQIPATSKTASRQTRLLKLTKLVQRFELTLNSGPSILKWLISVWPEAENLKAQATREEDFLQRLLISAIRLPHGQKCRKHRLIRYPIISEKTIEHIIEQKPISLLENPQRKRIVSAFYPSSADTSKLPAATGQDGCR